MSYRMIVLDLDGTLTNSQKVITPRTRGALMEAQERGVHVVLASGRPTYGVMPLARQLYLPEYGGFILSYNGGDIIRCKTKELMFHKGIPVESNQTIIHLALELGLDILTYEGDSVITNNQTCPYALREAAINRLPLLEKTDFEQYVDFPVTKYIMLADGEKLARLEPLVKEKLGDEYSVYRSEPFFLEIMAQGIDKAQSLARLLDRTGIKREEMMACGDGYNDLSMIRYAGWGVAMANAMEEVKEAADYVTLSNDEDGVGAAIEKFILQQ